MKTALSIGTLFCFVSYRAASAGAFVAPGHAAAGWTKRAEIAIVSAAASRERSDEGDGAAWATGCNSRRSTVERLARSTCATAGAALAFFASGSPLPPAAWASGGATAGGAYLLSAKQRYNERVKAGAAGFLRLEKSLKENDVEALRSYFSGADDAPSGTWKDLTAAGYLLANAFRRNSAAAPDTLPSVQVRRGKMRGGPFASAFIASAFIVSA
jgi:hypothetical protein